MLSKQLRAGIIAFFIIVGCKEEELPIVSPQIAMGEAADITTNSAILHAQIIRPGSEEVLAYGFRWEVDVDPSDASDELTLTLPFAEGAIQAPVKNLSLGATYYYQAYARTNNDVYLSPVASFTTLGPKLDSLSPTKGPSGTVVTIKGEHFGSDVNAVTVRAYGVAAEIVSLEENEITFIMPLSASGEIDVVVEVDEAISNTLNFNYQSTFTFLPSEIKSGKEIKVFVSNGSIHNTYRIGGIEVAPRAEIIQKGGREFWLVVPKDLPTGETSIEVFDSNGNALINATKTPLVVLQSGTWSRIQKFPDGDFFSIVGLAIDNKGYAFAGREAFLYDPLSDTWSFLRTFPDIIDFTFTKAVAIDDKAYLIEFNNVWEYDPASGSVVSRKPFPGKDRYSAAIFTDGINIFYGRGHDRNNSANAYADFWKYEPTVDTWTRLADFPEAELGVNHNPSGIFFDGKGYLLGEKNFAYDVVNDKFYASDIPVNTQARRMIFTLNKRLYYGLKSRDFYEYDPVKNKTEAETSFPGNATLDPFSFEINGSVYVGTGGVDVWKFVPGTD